MAIWFTTLPGVDRQIRVELHDPIENDLLILAHVGVAEGLTPEEFAAEMVTAGTALTVGTYDRDELTKRMTSARRYEKARRLREGGRTGAPRTVDSFKKAEDFALMVLYLESKGYRQAIRAVAQHWEESGQKAPTRRAIFEGLKVVRNWRILNLFAVVDIARKQWKLKPVPTKHYKPKRIGPGVN